LGGNGLAVGLGRGDTVDCWVVVDGSARDGERVVMLTESAVEWESDGLVDRTGNFSMNWMRGRGSRVRGARAGLVPVEYCKSYHASGCKIGEARNAEFSDLFFFILGNIE
jgi:hypothetical protein